MRSRSIARYRRRRMPVRSAQPLKQTIPPCEVDPICDANRVLFVPSLASNASAGWTSGANNCHLLLPCVPALFDAAGLASKIVTRPASLLPLSFACFTRHHHENGFGYLPLVVLSNISAQ